MKTIQLTLSLLCIILFSGIGQLSAQTADKEKPVIDLKAPKDGETSKIGDRGGIHFSMEIEDNDMLASYTIEVYSNFGSFNPHHTTGEATKDYTFEKTYDVSGRKKAGIHHHDVQVPADATPGNYHFIITCKDASGNESSITRNIVLIK